MSPEKKDQIQPCGCNAEGNPIMWNPWNKVVQCHKCGAQYEYVERAILADEPKEEGGPDVGDVIGWNDHDGINVAVINGTPFSPIHYLKPRGIKPIVLMRRAEVERRIEEAQ